MKNSTNNNDPADDNNNTSTNNNITENSSNQIINFTDISIIKCINTLDLKTKDSAGGGSELMTDSNIQRKNLSYLDGRELETASAWLSSDTATNTTGTTLTLEKEYSNSSGGASNKPWNQVG